MKTELLEKTSTPASKKCWDCGQLKPIEQFCRNASKPDGFGNWCKVCRYNFPHSEKGKLARRIYERRYYQSEKGKLVKRRKDQKYYNSEWGYAMHAFHRERYTLSGQRAKYLKERYHRIQDEAGYYHHTETFYPAYRFLKALENAPVVEIKV